MGIEALNHLVSFGKGSISLLDLSIYFIITGIILYYAVKGFVEYKKTGNYGNSYSYCFAMTEYVLTWIAVAIILIVDIALLVFGPIVVLEASGDKYIGENVSDEGMALVFVLIFLNVFVLPIVLYIQYLNYLYLKVISVKKGEIKDIKQPIANVDEPQENQVTNV